MYRNTCYFCLVPRAVNSRHFAGPSRHRVTLRANGRPLPAKDLIVDLINDKPPAQPRHSRGAALSAVAPPPPRPLLGALAALPVVAARHRVRGTPPSPVGRPCDGGIAAATTAALPLPCQVMNDGEGEPTGKRFLDRLYFRIHCVSYTFFIVFVFEFAGEIP